MFKLNYNPIVLWGVNRIKKNKNAIIIFNGPTGCQPKGSKVLMANGEWKNIEDIRVGDSVISPDKDGNIMFSKVTNTNYFFSKENYQISELTRGKKRLYKCSAEHQVPVSYIESHRLDKTEKRSYEYIIRDIEAKKLSKYSLNEQLHNRIGISSPEIKQYDGRTDCDLDPYLLGYFIGNGHYSSGALRITINNKDKEIISYLKKFNCISERIGRGCIDLAYSINSEVGKKLNKLGLYNKKSGDKFIPREAILSSSKYRWKLLSGLIDSDGTLSEDKSFSICTKSKRLSKDIVDLIYSLGGRANCKKVTKTIKSLNFVGKYHNIGLFINHTKLNLMSERKKKNSIGSCYRTTNQIAIKSRRINKSFVFGFTIDSPSQYYITDNWMITHNSGKTYAALELAREFAEALGTSFTIQGNMDFAFEKLLKKTELPGNTEPGTCFLFEEVGAFGSGSANREWQSQANKFFFSFMQTTRHRRQILILTCPHFTFLDKGTRSLVHLQCEMKGIDHKNKVSYCKPFLIQVNSRTGKFYFKYMKINIGGRRMKYKQMMLPCPPKELTEEYERVKLEYTTNLNKEMFKPKESKRVPEKPNQLCPFCQFEWKSMKKQPAKCPRCFRRLQNSAISLENITSKTPKDAHIT